MDNNLVQLNIGGTKYCTTKATLLARKTGEGDTFFDGLMGGRFPIIKDLKGYIFIDRNGNLFEPILDYLRTGKWKCPKHLDEQSVLEEARFYGIAIDQYQFLTDKSIPEMISRLQELKLDSEFERNKTCLPQISRIVSDGFLRCINAQKELTIVFAPSLETAIHKIRAKVSDKVLQKMKNVFDFEPLDADDRPEQSVQIGRFLKQTMILSDSIVGELRQCGYLVAQYLKLNCHISVSMEPKYVNVLYTNPQHGDVRIESPLYFLPTSNADYFFIKWVGKES